MKLIKVPDDRMEMLEEFCSKSMFTFEGIDILNSGDGLKEFEKLIREHGYEKDELIGYWFKGKLMNEAYGLTGSNAYPNDLTFLVIPDFYNPIFKLEVGARWFDDIVANNSIKQNAQDTGLDPDFDVDMD